MNTTTTKQEAENKYRNLLELGRLKELATKNYEEEKRRCERDLVNHPLILETGGNLLWILTVDTKKHPILGTQVLHLTGISRDKQSSQITL